MSIAKFFYGCDYGYHEEEFPAEIMKPA